MTPHGTILFTSTLEKGRSSTSPGSCHAIVTTEDLTAPWLDAIGTGRPCDEEGPAAVYTPAVP
ncbi:hypothetical protein HaLaN_11961, partial [Haematococcus lacustris]